MNRKVIAIICIAVLALSFASARVVNFAFGASFGSFKGFAPLSNDDATVNTPYGGTGFGFDSTLSFTIGQRAEIFFQEAFNFSGKSAYPEDGLNDDYLVGTLNYKSYAGYEHAIVTGPVKLSIGAAFVVEAVTTMYEAEAGGEKFQIFPLLLNFGVGATVKAEFGISKNFAFYAKGNVDYLPFSAFTIGSNISEEDVEFRTNSEKNLSFGASAGIILFF